MNEREVAQATGQPFQRQVKIRGGVETVMPDGVRAFEAIVDGERVHMIDLGTLEPFVRKVLMASVPEIIALADHERALAEIRWCEGPNHTDRAAEIISLVTSGEWSIGVALACARLEGLFIRANEQVDEHREYPGFVYFVANKRGNIKIGFSCDIKKRITGLKATTSHDEDPEMRLLASIRFESSDRALAAEKEFHRMFAGSRLHGEWFSPTEDLMNQVERIRQLTTESETEH